MKLSFNHLPLFILSHVIHDNHEFHDSWCCVLCHVIKLFEMSQYELILNIFITTVQVILLFIFIYFTKLHFLSVPASDSAEQLNLRCFYRFVDFKTESPKPTRKFKFCYRAWNYMSLYEDNIEIHVLVLMKIL